MNPTGSASPTWWVVFLRELRDLWVGGKALYLILIYSVLVGVYSYALASNAEVNLLPLKEMVLEMAKASIAVSLFMCLIIGADSVSGERERATLEGLLLTPTSRRQIVMGKLLAAVSLWPAALAMAIPYWVVLSKGDPVFGQAVLWAFVMGSILAPALAGVGMLMSIWSNTNKTSMLGSLAVYLVLLLATELSRPGRVETVAEVRRALLYQWVNPWDATSKFLGKMLLSNRPLSEVWYLLTLPVIFGIFVMILLLVFAGRDIRLEAGTARKFRSYWDSLRRITSRLAPRPVSRGTAPEPEARSAVEAYSISTKPRVHSHRMQPSGSGAPTWWLVFTKELRDLWLGGKALHLTLAYTIVLGTYSFMMARDSVLSLIPPNEMVFELLKAAIVVGVFVGVILGADSLSGERERATMEGLLLTPASRRQIVVGKFLAAVSALPAALAVTIPYMKVLSQGDDVFGPAVLWGALSGSLLTPAFIALGMFVGFWCNSNKTSMFMSLCLYLLFILPTTMPGHAQGGDMGQLIQWLNPLAAPRAFLASILVNNRTLTDIVGIAPLWSWLLSQVAFALLMFGLLFWYAGPGLRLEAGRAGRLPWLRARAAGVAGIACIAALLSASPAAAQEAAPQPGQAALPSPGQPAFQVSIDLDAKVVKAGTPVFYNTIVTNPGAEASPPLIVAMNIINLNAKGEVVDPEDWSPQRTQYTESLAPGQSVRLSWRVNAILDGDFMVYMVVIPTPAGREATSHPVASSGIHLTVTPFTRLNPSGVLPYAIGGPILLGLLILLVYRHRHRQIDVGGPK